MGFGHPAPGAMDPVAETALAKKIMTRLYVRERDRMFTIADARKTLNRFKHRSVWSGHGRYLTIVKINRTRPMSPTNAMVLEIPEAYRAIPKAVLEKAREIAAAAAPEEIQAAGSERECPGCNRTVSTYFSHTDCQYLSFDEGPDPQPACPNS